MEQSYFLLYKLDFRIAPAFIYECTVYSHKTFIDLCMKIKSTRYSLGLLVFGVQFPFSPHYFLPCSKASHRVYGLK